MDKMVVVMEFTFIFMPIREKGRTEFRTNTHTNDNRYFPNVTGLINGKFVITWHSN